MDRDEARLILEEGQTFAAATGNRRAHMKLSLSHGFALCTAGDVGAYLEIALENRRGLVATDDIKMQVEVWTFLAHGLWLAARFPEALKLTEEGFAVVSRDIRPEYNPHAEWTGVSPPHCMFSLSRGNSLNWTGRLREGIEELESCRRFAEELKSREWLAYSRFWVPEAYYLASDAAGASASAREAEEFSRAVGDPANMIVFKQVASGYAHLAAGRAADAAEQMREARREKRAAQEWSGQVTQILAEALLRIGDLSAAATSAEEAITLCRRSLRGNYEAIAHGVLARALLRRDGVSARAEVEAALDNAAQLIERTGASTLAPFLLEWRAELAAALGDEVTGEQRLRQAAQGYEEIGAPRHAQRLTVERQARLA
jgi:tetratricopeptide (TPR) repeat protein